MKFPIKKSVEIPLNNDAGVSTYCTVPFVLRVLPRSYSLIYILNLHDEQYRATEYGCLNVTLVRPQLQALWEIVRLQGAPGGSHVACSWYSTCSGAHNVSENCFEYRLVS